MTPADTGVTVTGGHRCRSDGMAENDDNDGNGTIMIDPTLQRRWLAKICSSKA